jgi:NADH-quinone oxidoreductase subunit G
MATITIDDKVIEFTGSPRLIELARENGIEIPHFCYHPALSISGNCRMCIVEIGTRQRDPQTCEFQKDGYGREIVNYVPKPQISCSQTAADGMVVSTKSEKIIEARKSVLEFILANHPLDCPVCDQAGECILQDYAFQYGFAKSRFKEKKRIYIRKKISNIMTPEMNRCIHCDRCARFTTEIVNDNSFTRTWRGNSLELSTLPGKIITHNYHGNMVDICPVGALTLTDFRFKSRTWFLKFGLTLCASCGKGCNVMVSYKDSKIFRLKPVYNEKVNSYWMCDYGRLRYEFLNQNRREFHLVNGKKAALETAVEKAAEMITSASKIGVIASAAESLESCNSLSHLFGRTVSTPHIDYRINEAQISNDHSLREGELLLAKDPYPNSTGARNAGLIPGPGGMTALELLSHPAKADLLIVILDDKILEHEDLLQNLSKIENLIIASPFSSKWDSSARVSFALKAYTETSGTFINIDGIAQSFKPVMRTWGKAADGAELFKLIAERLKP